MRVMGKPNNEQIRVAAENAAMEEALQCIAALESIVADQAEAIKRYKSSMRLVASTFGADITSAAWQDMTPETASTVAQQLDDKVAQQFDKAGES